MEKKMIPLAILAVLVSAMFAGGHGNCALNAGTCPPSRTEANEQRLLKEAEYEDAVTELKKLLLKAIGRLGLQTGLVIGDASTDLYLALQKMKDLAAKDSGAMKSGKLEGEMLAEWQRLERQAASARARLLAHERQIIELEAFIAGQEAKYAAAGNRPPPVPFDTSQVGEDDLLYGLYERPGSKGNAVDELQRRIGRGKLLGDVEGERLPKETAFIDPKTGRPQRELVSEWSRRNLTEAVRKGNKIIFDLTGIEDMENILRNQGTDPRRNISITARELRHIRNNWGSGGTFNNNNVIFVIQERDGRILRVPPPW